ncbi:MAG TPA: carboxypeptidase-like regulatory domain-containing protein [Bryobacteraceae bacterium]|nr:carboxypeptidase-like regulatory domain-containing protein [Bryobacteraceae bacterium]
MTLYCWFRLAVLCGLTVGVFGQQGDPRYSVAGVVVNSQNGETIKRAQVVMTCFDLKGLQDPNRRNDSDAPPGPQFFTTFTDEAGFFRSSGIPAGTCTLFAQKPGFTPPRSQELGALPAMHKVNVSASVEDVRLTLAPLGIITGKVVDQDEQPVRGVNITLLSQRLVDGMRQTSSVRNVATDDRGMYRLWNLQPGKYYVKAAGRSGGTFLYAGETAPRYMADEAFGPAYFGGSKTLDGSQPVLMEAGTEAKADFRLTMQPAYKIRGTLGSFVPRRTVKFELLSGDEDASASRVSVNGDTGTFQIQDVVPGSYTVRATQGETRAEATVSVAGGDVNGLAMRLSAGVDIPIRIHVTNPPAANRPRESQVAVPSYNRLAMNRFCNVSLHPPGRSGGRTFSSVGTPAAAPAGQAGGDQSIAGVLPGTYRVVVQCFGGYAQSAAYGTQDLLVNPMLTVQPGVDPASIDIVATQGGGTIIGTVAIESGKTSRITVLLVPQFTPTTGPLTTFAMGSSGFRFGGLAPGYYTGYAFSEREEVEFRNPNFLQALTGGVQVQVEDRQEAKMTIAGLVR